MEVIDYQQLYIEEKSKVAYLQYTIQNINLPQTLTEYLYTIVVDEGDFQYCYQNNLINTFKRCLNRNHCLPIKRENNKVLIYGNDQWIIYTKEHSKRIWNDLHRKILKHFLNFDHTNKHEQFERYVKKLFLYNVAVFEQHFFNYIKKNFIKK